MADISHAILGADFLYTHDLIADLKRKRLVCGVTLVSSPGFFKQPTTFGMHVLTETVPQLVQQILSKFPNVLKPPIFIEKPLHNFVHTITSEGLPIASKPGR